MNNLAENNLIRFVNVTQKKGTIYANFKVKGIRNGVLFSASITVDLSSLDLSSADSLEKIVEECARHGVKEFKKADFQFQGIVSQNGAADYLGVAQLG